ncbi:Sensor protein TorS [Piscirickettsia salmonis]|uniref:histidine kinase n=1 Tax=Piscirickettsia salmonis TaxID=1238 RepID=A0AAC8VF88_PISSA|nr:HAMP domain-containing sensor histidine kinase [Piscirickettsia salmonis]ALB21312.1 Histidine kinase ATPase [Piscirickettsia salmonis]QGO00069.1 Sensor protein TorS [Piscirickettsia salmonis]QGO03719.1 Sensor protein TorS [Piscirickettsia salmonis]QGO14344.1 Sensor protein TorS [Piscirickettsia salmonis]QGO21445.1 Sensor protein TorS [Piscirickettsia salmonis]
MNKKKHHGVGPLPHIQQYWLISIILTLNLAIFIASAVYGYRHYFREHHLGQRIQDYHQTLTQITDPLAFRRVLQDFDDSAHFNAFLYSQPPERPEGEASVCDYQEGGQALQHLHLPELTATQPCLLITIYYPKVKYWVQFLFTYHDIWRDVILSLILLAQFLTSIYLVIRLISIRAKLATQVLSYKGQSVMEIGRNLRPKDQLDYAICDVIREKTSFISALAHDVKTPLARLGLKIEDLELAPDSHTSLMRDFNMLKDLIASAERFVKEGAVVAPEQFVTINAANFLTNIIQDYQEFAASIHLNIDVAATVALYGDYSALRRAIENLLNNALHAADSCLVYLRQESDQVLIKIENEGQIDPVVLTSLFEPYHSSRGSTGLGLAIVKVIIEAHCGQVSLENLANKRVCACIRLPIDVTMLGA